MRRSRYKPGQVIHFHNKGMWPVIEAFPAQDLVELNGTKEETTYVGDALIVAQHPGPVRYEVMTKNGKSIKHTYRVEALMVLLPIGQVGWIVSEHVYPVVTVEVDE